MTPDISISFPHPVLTPLANIPPTQKTLALLHEEINANAISVRSSRGSGTLGYLALTVSAANYTAASGGTVFAPPRYPGDDPIHRTDATPSEITETNRSFLAHSVAYERYCVTAAALKALILAAVPDTFTNKLRLPGLGYATISALDILTHLDKAYGTVSAADLNNNIALLHKPWSGSQPMEELFTQTRHCIEFAKLTDPISDASAVRAVLSNLENTGLFLDDLRDWDKLAPALQLLDTLESTFLRADQNRRSRTVTTSAAGYHHAAAVIPAAPTTRPPIDRHATPSFYCWSHGLGRNPAHTSTTCSNQCPGHRTEATLNNMLGGCNNIHRRQGEPTVWKSKTQANPAAPR